MKKISIGKKLLFTTIIFFIVTSLVSQQALAQKKSDLKPTMKDRIVVQVVATLLERFHYSERKINKDVSPLLFDRHLNKLDPYRYFFLQADIDEFAKHKKSLHEKVKGGDTSFAFLVYNRFLQRVEERLEFAKKRVNGSFDFTVEDTIEIDRSKSPWAKSQEELNELWRKRIKNQVLQAKLGFIKEEEEAKKDGEEIKKEAKDWKEFAKERVVKRYERYLEYLSENDNYDIVEMYMSSLAEIFDPHSSYMNWRTLDNFDIALKLSLQGIGVMVSSEDGYTKVMRLIPGGPAEKQGQLKPGMRIIAVSQDGDSFDSVVDMPLHDVVQKIRGKKGTNVTLSVIKTLQGTPFSVKITRDEVKLEEQAAKGEVKEVAMAEGEKPLKVGIINLPSFYTDFSRRNSKEKDFRSSVRDVRKLISSFQKQNIDGVVMDLRGNGGGSLEEAIELTGLFIPEGPVVQIRDNENIRIRHDEDGGFAYNLPLVVVVDASSASASEIFAAAIQDYNRGIVVGAKTHGKGTVQNLLSLSRIEMLRSFKPGAIKYTTAKFYRVNGGSTQLKGVQPDIIFPSFESSHDEASLDNALPWDEIGKLKYSNTINNISSHREALRKLYNERESKNSRLAQLRLYINKWEEREEQKEISLKIDQRKKDQEEREEWYQKISTILGQNQEENLDEEIDGESDEESKTNQLDLYLDESLEVIKDLIHISSK